MAGGGDREKALDAALANIERQFGNQTAAGTDLRLAWRIRTPEMQTQSQYAGKCDDQAQQIAGLQQLQPGRRIHERKVRWRSRTRTWSRNRAARVSAI